MTRIHLGDDIREIEFPIGSNVYHRCRDEPIRGLVTGYGITPGEVLYCVTWGSGEKETRHYAIELTTTHQPCYHTDTNDDQGEQKTR